MKSIEEYNIDLNNELIKRAFTHSSYVNETKKGEDYERLEFLGDKVLDFLVSEYLYVNEHLHEGEMTKLRANYVCENALYEYSKEFRAISLKTSMLQPTLFAHSSSKDLISSRICKPFSVKTTS